MMGLWMKGHDLLNTVHPLGNKFAQNVYINSSRSRFMANPSGCITCEPIQCRVSRNKNSCIRFITVSSLPVLGRPRIASPCWHGGFEDDLKKWVTVIFRVTDVLLSPDPCHTDLDWLINLVKWEIQHTDSSVASVCVCVEVTLKSVNMVIWLFLVCGHCSLHFCMMGKLPLSTINSPTKQERLTRLCCLCNTECFIIVVLYP